MTFSVPFDIRDNRNNMGTMGIYAAAQEMRMERASMWNASSQKSRRSLVIRIHNRTTVRAVATAAPVHATAYKERVSER